MNDISCVFEIVERILAVIGLISFIVAVVRIIWIFKTNITWINNVSVKQLPLPNNSIYDTSLQHTSTGECIFPEIYSVDETDYTQTFLFRPNDSIIKKMRLYKITKYDKKMNPKRKRLIKEFKKVSPFRPIAIKITLPEFIPHYYVCWAGDFGVKTAYYFQMNGRDGNIDSYGMSCKIGFWSKIRRIIGLK